jgi:hypothetical protein
LLVCVCVFFFHFPTYPPSQICYLLILFLAPVYFLALWMEREEKWDQDWAPLFSCRFIANQWLGVVANPLPFSVNHFVAKLVLAFCSQPSNYLRAFLISFPLREARGQSFLSPTGSAYIHVHIKTRVNTLL